MRQADENAHKRFDAEIQSHEGGQAVVSDILSEMTDHLRSAAFESTARELLRQSAVLCWSAFELFARDLHGALFSSEAAGVKAAIRAIVSSDPIVFMKSYDLWALFQRRHLIVHRRGIVDAEYRNETGDTLPIGADLQIAPAELRTYVARTTGAATALLR